MRQDTLAISDGDRFLSLSSALEQLPSPSERNIAVHVKPAAERALRGGHPWLFEGSIRDTSFEGDAGDIAVIFDRKDRFLAVGLYDPHSDIRVKVLQHNDPAQIGRAWFAQTLHAAVTLREPLAQTEDTNGYRLVYGENDHMPGLVVDRYAETLVVKLYTAAWLPHLRDVLHALVAVQPCERLVLRLSRNMQDTPLYGLADGQTLIGEPPTAPVIFKENGLYFAADVIEGHKTGFFFDQRDNREHVRELSFAGASVLDVFAYTGGFSVYAASGAAGSVLSMDASEPALAMARKNFSLNAASDPGVAMAAHDTMLADAFKGLETLWIEGYQFDMVVIDPPAFAKQQAEVDGALRAYARLAELGARLVREGGHLVMASCSSRVKPDAFFNIVLQSAGRPLYNQQRTGHALDHPVRFPEGEYLKCLFSTVG